MRGLPFFKPKNKPQFAGFNFNDGSSSGGSYTLPTATNSRLGGIKVGSGLSVEPDGTLSASGGGGGGGFTFTDSETVVGNLAGADLYCKKVSIPDSFFTGGSSYEIPNTNNIKILFAYARVNCTDSGGYVRTCPCDACAYNNYGSTIQLLGSTVSVSSIESNTGHAYIFYTKTS